MTDLSADNRFRDWLKKQSERDDVVGDLAQDALRDPRWTGDCANSLSTVMCASIHTCTEARNAFSEAEEEFWVWVLSVRARDVERAKLSPKLRFEVLSRDSFTCQACGRSREHGVVLHVDHITAIARGGRTEKGNLQTLCSECNLGKGVSQHTPPKGAN